MVKKSIPIFMESYSDAQLVVSYLKGNEVALEVLIKRYLKLVYNFVFRFVGNEAEAENISQETFVKMWKNLKKYDSQKASFKTWLFGIAKNSAIDYLRKKKALPLLNLDNVVDLDFSVQEKVEQKIKANFLKSATKGLSQKYQEILLLRYQNELTFRQIAAYLNKPLNTVKSWHRRALLALKEMTTPRVW